MVTMGPMCLTKLTRKRKLVRALGFFLEFFSQLISTTGSWDSPRVYQVTHGDHGTSASVSDKIDKKTKVGQNNRLFLRIFSYQILTTGSWDSPPVYLVTMVTMETMGPDMSVQLPDNVLTLTDTLQMYFRHHGVIYWWRRDDGWVVGGWWKVILVSTPWSRSVDF